VQEQLRERTKFCFFGPGLAAVFPEGVRHCNLGLLCKTGQ